MEYGYDPHRGVEQFYDCELPEHHTAPVTFWMRDNADFHAVDVSMPDGHVIRAVTPALAESYAERGGVILPDPANPTY